MDGGESKAQARISKDSQVWKAWLEYRESSSFQNTKHHASNPDHTEGSLWAAFYVGWIEGCKIRFREQTAKVMELNQATRDVRYDGPKDR